MLASICYIEFRISRSSHPEVFFKKGVLRIFSQFFFCFFFVFFFFFFLLQFLYPIITLNVQSPGALNNLGLKPKNKKI